jgi:hypothetical protein
MIDLKAVLETIYRDFFTLGLAGSDLTATKSAFKTTLQNLDVNTEKVDAYLNALESYVIASVENPTYSQILLISSKFEEFNVAEKNCILSFEGLSNIEFDIFFFVDLRNFFFNEMRTLSLVSKTVMSLFPGSSHAYFLDPFAPTNFANYMFSAIDVSIRIKSEK